MDLKKKNLKVTTKVTITGGVRSHDKLHNLDYESSGHTGFASEKDLKELREIVEEIAQSGGGGSINTWVTGVKGEYGTEFKTGKVIITKEEMGLGNVLNVPSYSKSEIDTELSEIRESIENLQGGGENPPGDLSNYYTIKEVDNKLISKVDKVDGFNLVAEEEIEKLKNIAANAEENYIKNVNTNEFDVSSGGRLSVNQIELSKVNGIYDALNNASKIDAIQFNGTDLAIENKKVNIEFNSSEFYLTDDNKITIKKISLDKLVDKEEGEELVLNGGGA